MNRSKISWADFSGGDLNFAIRGKSCPISPGCAHCYVARDFARYGREMPETTTIYPEKLRRLARANFTDRGKPFRRGPGSRPIAFPCDYGDLFHADIPHGLIMEAFLIMSGRDDIDWAVLTKRALYMKNMVDYFVQKYGPFPLNIWTIVSIEDQERANERLPLLMQTRSSIKGLSIEPMLEPINIWTDGTKFSPFINWVICGAESGPNRRPFKVEWAESIYRECDEIGIPFFGKQDSGLHPGKPLLIHGKEVKEYPRNG